MSVREVITQLERAGCEPRQIGPGQWLALCPECRASVTEIRELVNGAVLLACQQAHEPMAVAA